MFGVALFLFLIALAVLFWLVGIYNRLVALRNRFKNAWAQIDVQLKRRYDLIPNLVETVKGYAAHERGTLEAVIQARQQAINITDNVIDKAKAENMLSQTLRSLFAVRPPAALAGGSPHRHWGSGPSGPVDVSVTTDMEGASEHDEGQDLRSRRL